MKVAVKTKKVTLLFLFGMTLAVGLVMALRLSIGVIPAAGQAGTVSAKGSGQVPLRDECSATPPFGCVGGGQGVQFSFAFTGPAETFPDQGVPATGTFSATVRDTGDQIQFVTGSATIVPDFHEFHFLGACNITHAGQTLPGSCFVFAQENAQPNSQNIMELEFSGGPISFGFACCNTVSGSMQID
jgi:hypothetical protein